MTIVLTLTTLLLGAGVTMLFFLKRKAEQSLEENTRSMREKYTQDSREAQRKWK